MLLRGNEYKRLRAQSNARVKPLLCASRACATLALREPSAKPRVRPHRELRRAPLQLRRRACAAIQGARSEQ